MVALFHGFTHDASAHTSYLLLVKELVPQSMAFRSSDQHKKPAASPFGATAWLRPFFKNLTPVPERADHYNCYRIFTSTIFRNIFPLTGQSQSSEGAL
jgi:hypothetical protein